jgi:diacylglycerol kinase family enzyme
MKLHMDQAEALEHVTPFLFVGNNRYQTSGLEIGTRSRLDSGQLWVCTAPRTNRQNFVQLALKTLVGRDTDQDLSAFEVKEIWVQPGTPRVNVSTDCDLIVIQRVWSADELLLTNSIATFVRHASTGRVASSRISSAIYFELKSLQTRSTGATKLMQQIR